MVILALRSSFLLFSTTRAVMILVVEPVERRVSAALVNRVRVLPSSIAYPPLATSAGTAGAAADAAGFLGAGFSVAVAAGAAGPATSTAVSAAVVVRTTAEARRV